MFDLFDLFEDIKSEVGSLIGFFQFFSLDNISFVRVAAQQQEKMGLKVEERIAAAICKNPRLMKAGITLEFKEVMNRVSQHMINNMDKMRVTRLKDGVAPGAGVKWTAARTLD